MLKALENRLKCQILASDSAQENGAIDAAALAKPLKLLVTGFSRINLYFNYVPDTTGISRALTKMNPPLPLVQMNKPGMVTSIIKRVETFPGYMAGSGCWVSN